MEAFLVSTGIVALAEMGDKTQLLSLVLAARFRKPWPIVLGILVATLANHALAGAAGAWVTTLLGPDVLRWVLGGSFIAMAVWMLIPDKLDEGEGDRQGGGEDNEVVARDGCIRPRRRTRQGCHGREGPVRTDNPGRPTRHAGERKSGQSPPARRSRQ